MGDVFAAGVISDWRGNTAGTIPALRNGTATAGSLTAVVVQPEHAQKWSHRAALSDEHFELKAGGHRPGCTAWSAKGRLLSPHCTHANSKHARLNSSCARTDSSIDGSVRTETTCASLLARTGISFLPAFRPSRMTFSTPQRESEAGGTPKICYRRPAKPRLAQRRWSPVALGP